ncbi:hypothetical protein, partial [Salmonella sp. s51884]|uniref:hypothetical protein n=1 Tax=Salmonella sp. s51884 TaxID=3159654 RepID=UPI00397EC296
VHQLYFWEGQISLSTSTFLELCVINMLKDATRELDLPAKSHLTVTTLIKNISTPDLGSQSLPRQLTDR